MMQPQKWQKCQHVVYSMARKEDKVINFSEQMSAFLFRVAVCVWTHCSDK